jgi:hypothetical protein
MRIPFPHVVILSSAGARLVGEARADAQVTIVDSTTNLPVHACMHACIRSSF